MMMARYLGIGMFLVDLLKTTNQQGTLLRDVLYRKLYRMLKYNLLQVRAVLDIQYGTRIDISLANLRMVNVIHCVRMATI